MQEDSPVQPTHPDNVQGTAPVQSPRPDLVIGTARPPGSSLVTTIPTHDRGATAGASQGKSPPHPRESPPVPETWRSRGSGRETPSRNSSPSPTRQTSPVSRARPRDRENRRPSPRRSSPALRTSTCHRDANQNTPSRHTSPASQALCRRRRSVRVSQGSPTTVRGQRYRPDSVDRSSPSCQNVDDRRSSSGSPLTPDSSRRRRDAGRGTTQRRPSRTSRDRATVRTLRLVRRHTVMPATVHVSHTDRHRSRHATVRAPLLVRRHIVVPTTVGTHADRRPRTRHLCVAAAAPAATPRGASRHRLHAADITVVTAIIRPNPSRRQRRDVPVVATMLVATLLPVSCQRHRLPAVAATPAPVRRLLDETHRWPLMEFPMTALLFAATAAHRRCSPGGEPGEPPMSRYLFEFELN